MLDDEGGASPPADAEGQGTDGAKLVVEVSSLDKGLCSAGHDIFTSGAMDVPDDQESLWYAMHDQLAQEGHDLEPSQKRACVAHDAAAEAEQLPPAVVFSPGPHPLLPLQAEGVTDVGEALHLPSWDHANTGSVVGARGPFVDQLRVNALSWGKGPPARPPGIAIPPPLSGLRPPVPASVRPVAAKITEVAAPKIRGKRGGKNLQWWDHKFYGKSVAKPSAAVTAPTSTVEVTPGVFSLYRVNNY